jgi:hypothetical protein
VVVSAAPRVMPQREYGERESLAQGSEKAPSLEEIVGKISMLESSGGKNNYSKCERIGKYNRYGYGIPGNGNYMCFEKDEDTKAVYAWFEDKLKTHDLESAACGYNTGVFERGCKYFQNFVSI